MQGIHGCVYSIHSHVQEPAIRDRSARFAPVPNVFSGTSWLAHLGRFLVQIEHRIRCNRIKKMAAWANRSIQ
eukprot:7378100-Prymnesium_polylepis.1